MLAGLSIAHAMVPPHPAPTLAVAAFHADAGKKILYAILNGIPTGIFAGPILRTFFPLIIADDNLTVNSSEG